MTKKSGEHSAQHTEPLDSCFDLIIITVIFPLEIGSATTEWRAETIPLRYWSTSHTSDARLTTDGKCAANQPDVPGS